MTTPTRLNDMSAEDRLEKIMGWMQAFQENVSKDHGLSDLNKIRKSTGVLDKLRMARVGVDVWRLSKIEDNERRLQAVRRMIPRLEKLLAPVERGTGKSLKQFGAYLPPEARNQDFANMLRDWGAERLATAIEANIPPADSPDARPKPDFKAPDVNLPKM
ncbi:MAG: hypothetical protein Alpg2KO_24580 [Alphaproteobacteria bacterium]